MQYKENTSRNEGGVAIFVKLFTVARWRHQVAGGANWHCQLIDLAPGDISVKYKQNLSNGLADIGDNVTDSGAP